MSSPFNEEKYKRLLEGLEISEVKWSYVKSQSDVVRFDSYYYTKEFLSDENIITKQKNKTLKELNAELLSFGAYSLNNFVEYKDYGIPFIRGVNMKDGVLDFSDILYIDDEAHNLLWKSEVKPNTILLSMSGTIGDVAIAMPEYKYPMNSNQDIAKITLKSGLNPFYLYAFLRSKYGQNFLKREARGSVQQHVFLSQMENIRVPLLNIAFQNHIEQIVKAGHASLSKSKSLYSEAEDCLLAELGLKSWQPNNKSVNIKQLKESYLLSGRLDAEYYQPKYDELFSKLSKFKCDTIKHIANTKKSVEPGSEAYQDSGIPFVRVSDVSKFGISAPSIFLSPNDFDLKELQPKKDTILLSKDGSVGIAYKVEEDMNCITSGALLHLSIFNQDYTPDYLTLVLNSIVVQMQAERDSNGAIIQHWKPSEIEQVIIPKLPKSIQKAISAKIQESFALKDESKRLLDEAKMMVEREIEKGGE